MQHRAKQRHLAPRERQVGVTMVYVICGGLLAATIGVAATRGEHSPAHAQGRQVTHSTTKPTSVQTSPAGSPSTAARGPITYVVKPGDNLSTIADWFKLHGYGDLYRLNTTVVGSNPNLIRPGQKITISSTGMAVGS